MYKICGLQLGPNFGGRRAACKSFYLWLTFEKIRAFAVFTEKYMLPYGWSGSNFTTAAEIQSATIEIQIVEVQI